MNRAADPKLAARALIVMLLQSLVLSCASVAIKHDNGVPPRANNTSPQDVRSEDNRLEESPLEISVQQSGATLAWSVKNNGSYAVWAFLYVPSARSSPLRAEFDTAWVRVDDTGTVVLSKIDTPIPPGVLTDTRLRTGAVRLNPGDERSGALVVGNEVTAKLPYSRPRGGARVVKKLQMEIGWVPVRSGQRIIGASRPDQAAVFLDMESEAGGQRIARSTALDWVSASPPLELAARAVDESYLEAPGALADDRPKDDPSSSIVPPYPDNYAGSLPDGTKKVGALKVEKQHTVNHGMGEVTIYPDSYDKILAPNTFLLSDYRRRLAIYSRIYHGSSKVVIDTTNLMTDADSRPYAKGSPDYARAAAGATKFRKGVLRLLGRLILAKAVGYKLMSALDGGTEIVKIAKQRFSTGVNSVDFNVQLAFGVERAPVKTGSTVWYDPALTTYGRGKGQPEEPWMTERHIYGFYHELVHAYHGVTGTYATGLHKGMLNEEWMTLGVGPYVNEDISDNAIRKAMGKSLRPEYGGVVYDDFGFSLVD